MIIKLGYGYGSVVIPDKYKNEECKSVAAEINKTSLQALCIPSPKTNAPTGMSNPPSYIDNMPKFCSGPNGLEKCK